MFKRLISLALAGALSLGLNSAVFAAQGTGCMPTTGTVSGLTFAQDVNAGIAALISSNSGASAPATDCTAAAVKGQVWLDTSTTPNILKQYDGTSWVVLGALDSSNHLWSPPIGGGTTTVTAASTTDICAAPAAVQTISGTTTITSFGSSCVVGVRKTLIFASATPITYDATALILPGQRSYTTAAGDMADAIYLGSGNWRVKDISKIDGSSVTNPALPLGSVLYGDFATIPPKTLVGTGQAISRSTYPDYLAAVTRTQTVTLTAGTNTITSVPSTRGFGVGMPLEGIGIPAGTTIASVTSSTIVMSSPNVATANGSRDLTVFITGYGSGGDSTTVGVKNCVGRLMAGLDPSATNLSAASAINSTQGSATRTLAANNLPTTSPWTIGISDTTAYSFTFTNGTTATTGGGTFVNSIQATGGGSGTVVPPKTGSVTATPQPNTGGDTAFGIVPPISVAECVVAVLP